MDDKLREHWLAFGKTSIVAPCFNPKELLDSPELNEQIKYGVGLGNHRTSVLNELNFIGQQVEVIKSTDYGVDAVYRLFWLHVRRFFQKLRIKHAASRARTRASAYPIDTTRND